MSRSNFWRTAWSVWKIALVVGGLVVLFGVLVAYLQNIVVPSVVLLLILITSILYFKTKTTKEGLG